MRLCGLDAVAGVYRQELPALQRLCRQSAGHVGRRVVRDVRRSAGQAAADRRFPRDRRPRHGRLGPALRTQGRHAGRRRTGRHGGFVPGLRRDSRRRLRGRGRNRFRVRLDDQAVPGRHGARRAGLGPVGDSGLVASLRLHQRRRHEPGVVCPRAGQPGEEAGGRDAGAIEPPGRTARPRAGRSRFRAALGRPRVAEPAGSARQLGRAELVAHRRPSVPGGVGGRRAGVLYLPRRAAGTESGTENPGAADHRRRREQRACGTKSRPTRWACRSCRSAGTKARRWAPPCWPATASGCSAAWTRLPATGSRPAALSGRTGNGRATTSHALARYRRLLELLQEWAEPDRRTMNEPAIRPPLTPQDAYPPADKPTMYFIGVTTHQSSIMKVFPRWAEYLSLGDVAIQGMNFRWHDEPANYRRAVAFIKDDPLSLGALVTTHKLDLLSACRDQFDRLDQFAELMHEISSISKDGGAAGRDTPRTRSPAAWRWRRSCPSGIGSEPGRKPWCWAPAARRSPSRGTCCRPAHGGNRPVADHRHQPQPAASGRNPPVPRADRRRRSAGVPSYADAGSDRRDLGRAEAGFAGRSTRPGWARTLPARRSPTRRPGRNTASPGISTTAATWCSSTRPALSRTPGICRSKTAGFTSSTAGRA